MHRIVVVLMFSLIPVLLPSLQQSNREQAAQQRQASQEPRPPLEEKSTLNSYEVVPNWSIPYPKAGYTWGSITGVFAESPNRIFVAMRGEIKLPDPLPASWGGFYGTIARNAIRAPGNEIRNCLFVLDGNGKVIESWTQWDHLFEGTNGPHKIRISPYDPQHRLWVVNDSRHTIYAFSNDGKKLLMSLGEENVAGADEKHFGRPQDLAFLPDGSILVADGLTNSRVVKLDKNGRFLLAWGTKGTEPGQFSAVHAVEVDRNRRVYVSDRGNKRIQVFDENGKHLATWPDLRFANHILVSANQDVWVIDNMTAEMVRFDANGKRLFSWHLSGKQPGLFNEMHQFSVDPEGTLYAVDNVLGRIQKFKPRPGAEKSNLIGAPVSLMKK